MLSAQSPFTEIEQETGSLLESTFSDSQVATLTHRKLAATEQPFFETTEPEMGRLDPKEKDFYSQVAQGRKKLNSTLISVERLKEGNETELTEEVAKLILDYLFYLGKEGKAIWQDKVKMKRKTILERLYLSLTEAKRNGYDTRLAKRCFVLVQQLKEGAPFNHQLQSSELYSRLCLLEKQLRDYEIPVKSINEARLEKQLLHLQHKIDYLQQQMTQLLVFVQKCEMARSEPGIDLTDRKQDISFHQSAASFSKE